jgi:hypothetical protein
MRSFSTLLQISTMYALLLPKEYFTTAFAFTAHRNTSTTISTSSSREYFLSSLKEPDEKESQFGRQTYWNECYEKEDEFSWYAEWNGIQPFFTELVPLSNAADQDQDQDHHPPRILLPGIGNDRSMVDMYDYGYTRMSAFDYAEEGVECAKKFFADRDCDLRVLDCRNLSSYEQDSFDAILEKGTLDAVYLSGAHDKALAVEYLDMAVSEMARVLCKGGIVMSITAACADAVQASFGKSCKFRVLRDGGFYATEDGFTSNNIDATIFAWERI